MGFMGERKCERNRGKGVRTPWFKGFWGFTQISEICTFKPIYSNHELKKKINFIPMIFFMDTSVLWVDLILSWSVWMPHASLIWWQ